MTVSASSLSGLRSSTSLAGKPRIRVAAGDATGATARPSAITFGPPRTHYHSADPASQAMAGWNPSLLPPDDEWLWERDVSVARMRDLERNEGWAASGIDRLVDMLVGGVFRLNAKPDALGLGITEDEAHDLGDRIQERWRAWAEDPTFRCDAERQLNFAGLLGLMAREFVGPPGEALAVLRWIEREGFPSTCLQVIDADRMSNPNEMPDTDELRAGVQRDANGAPIGYHIRRQHPNEMLTANLDSFVWDYIPRWDRIGAWERPKVLHLYDKRRPGQTRGISRLVAALSKLRMLSRYSQHELQTAAINATIVGSIYTQLGAEYASEALAGDGAAGGGAQNWDAFVTSRAGFYEKSRGAMADSRFLTLFPSDRVDLQQQGRQTAGYQAFQKAFLQAFAATIGITYEQLSADWGNVNYSSARAALNEVWRGVTRLRSLIVSQAALPVYAAWLEDELDRGTIDVPSAAPDFYDAPAAWCRSKWIGPGRGWVDPVKEAQASTLRRDGMLSTLEDEAAEQGQDWEMVLEQLAREARVRARLGLGEPSTDLAIVPASDGQDRRPVEN